jgi:hypothetical protein
MKSFLQSLYDDGAAAGDFAVIRISADEIVHDNNLRPASTGYDLGLSNQFNRPYHPATLSIGALPEVADSFGGAEGLINDIIDENYQTGYGFTGGWTLPSNVFAAKATIGRPTFFEPDQPEPIVVTTGLGTFDGGYTGARITGDFGFINSPIRRQLATPASGDVYFRFLFRPEVGFDSNDLVGLWLSDTAGSDETDFTQDGVVLGLRNGGEVFGSIDGTTTAVSATITVAETYLLIGRLYEASPGSGLNRLDYWLNPDDENEAPLSTVALGGNGFNAVTHVGVMTSSMTELEDFYLFDHFALSGSKQRIGFVTPDESIPGDFNHDNRVDGADYVVWRKGLGTVFMPEDYITWREHFGESMGSASLGDGTVPEPAGVLLVLVSCTAVVAQAVGRRRESAR